MSPRQRLRHLFRVALPPLAFFALVIALWHAGVRLFQIEPFLLPGPLDVGAAVSRHLQPLVHAARLTATGALGGFCLRTTG